MLNYHYLMLLAHVHNAFPPAKRNPAAIAGAAARRSVLADAVVADAAVAEVASHAIAATMPIVTMKSAVVDRVERSDKRMHVCPVTKRIVAIEIAPCHIAIIFTFFAS